MLINLCDHPVSLVFPTGNTRLTLPRCLGKPARVVYEKGTHARVIHDGEEVVVASHNALRVLNLPEPQEGVFYVASSATARAAVALGRTDVLALDTGPSAFREEGRRAKPTRLYLPGKGG